ncbi:N-acetyltransferase family protein [Micromonospora sp. M12]
MLMAEITVRPMSVDDADRVLAIYQAGLDGGDASFETTAPTWAAFDAARLPQHRFVADDGDGAVIGGSRSHQHRPPGLRRGGRALRLRRPAARGQGVARLLLDTLITSTEAAGIWTIQSGVFGENTASLTLHQRAGFRVIGVRERVGRHHGRWRDVILLERRSRSI